ncbi:hypothetical protein MMC13_000576 [Lambiella insularis]|nr:hypothetical protein [Lambiella insularis]
MDGNSRYADPHQSRALDHWAVRVIDIDASPYHEGNTIDILVTPVATSFCSTYELPVTKLPAVRTATILKVVQPLSTPVILVVSLLPRDHAATESDEETHSRKPLSPERNRILRIYDRRYCPDVRTVRYAKGAAARTVSWNEHVEMSLRCFAENSPKEFRVAASDRAAVPQEDWSDVENEIYFAKRCCAMQGNEVAAYTRMKDLQGVCISHLSDQVQLIRNNLGPMALSHQKTAFLEPRGILIDLPDGPGSFLLEDLAVEGPEKDWQAIMHAVYYDLDQISRCGIINRGARPSNIFIEGEAFGGDEYWVPCFTDFAHCELRDKATTDEEWQQKIRAHDIEGALGRTMTEKLLKAKYPTEKEKGRRKQKVEQWDGDPFPWEYKPAFACGGTHYGRNIEWGL